MGVFDRENTIFVDWIHRQTRVARCVHVIGVGIRGRDVRFLFPCKILVIRAVVFFLISFNVNIIFFDKALDKSFGKRTVQEKRSRFGNGGRCVWT